jgi:hypothetical protein
VLVRCLNKITRHVYNAYLACSLKLQYFWVDWLRMSSFYIFYTAEFILAVALTLTTMPYIKEAGMFGMPNRINFCLDLPLVYFALLCLSVPNFISTWLYLHHKRS